MALLAVALDIAVLEITPHLEHFSSSRLRPSAGPLWKTCEHNTDNRPCRGRRRRGGGQKGEKGGVRDTGG